MEVNENNDLRKEKLMKFREMQANLVDSGKLYCHQLKSIQETLQEKELLENCKLFNSQFEEEIGEAACRDPLEGHQITKEYRTKMLDWLVEVSSSFKCSTRAYFLAVTIFDKVHIASHQHGTVLCNKDIHPIGVVSIYMASKFEDVYPLQAKIVAEKIAHGSISA